MSDIIVIVFLIVSDLSANKITSVRAAAFQNIKAHIL